MAKVPLDRDMEFRDWLHTNKNLSKRVQGDYSSRCKRVQKDLNVNLCEYIDGDEKFLNLVSKIELLYIDDEKTRSTRDNCGSIVRAVKAYRLFYKVFHYKE